VTKTPEEQGKERQTVIKEYVNVILPFQVLERIVDKPLRIRGIAMAAGMSRNFNIYTPDEMQAFAQKLVSAPVYIEHVAVPNAVGKVIKTEWDGQNLWYEAEIYDDEVAEKIRKGLIQHVSVGADYERIDILNGKVPHGLHNAELSLVAVPGIPETNIHILESLSREQAKAEQQDFILYQIRDLSVFSPEHFTVGWVDRNLGIQALYGRLLENPASIEPFALLFMKASGWAPDKIESWLKDHPQYARQGLAPQPVGVQPCALPPSVVGVEKLSENENRKENEPSVLKPLIAERVWTRRYINDLPDSSFALILPGGEKDETGRTKPRSLRMFPYKDAEGRVDLPHLRNANARLPQAKIPEEQRAKAQRVLVAVKKKLGIGAAAEEMKLYEEIKADEVIPEKIEALPEPTSDEFLASLEDVLEEIWEEIEKLKLQTAENKRGEVSEQKPQQVSDLTESLLQKPKEPTVPLSRVKEKILSRIPPEHVLRAWSPASGGYRLAQEIKRAVKELEAEAH